MARHMHGRAAQRLYRICRVALRAADGRARHHRQMRTFVWLDWTDQSEWHIAVAVGDTVRWTTVAFSGEWVAALLGDGSGMPVPLRWEDSDEADSEVVGTVRSIRVMTVDHKRRSAGWSAPHGEPPGGIWEVVPGTARLRAVGGVTENHPLDTGEPAWSVQGWIVEIERGVGVK